MGRRPIASLKLPGWSSCRVRADMSVDFLQANEVRVLVGLDDLDDPLQTIAAIATANPLMNVITQKSHGHPSRNVQGVQPGGSGLPFPRAGTAALRRTCARPRARRAARRAGECGVVALPSSSRSIGRSSAGNGMQLGRNQVSPHPADPPEDQQVMDRPVSEPVTDQVGTGQDPQVSDGKGGDRSVEAHPDQMAPPLLAR